MRLERGGRSAAATPTFPVPHHLREQKSLHQEVYARHALGEVLSRSRARVATGGETGKVSIALHCAVVCNGCGARVTSDLEVTGLQLSRVYTQCKKNAEKQKWLFKNEGSKGIKHYCPKCYGDLPEIATWHMKRILLGKNDHRA